MNHSCNVSIYSTRQRELISRLSQPKSAVAATRRSSESGILSDRSSTDIDVASPTTSSATPGLQQTRSRLTGTPGSRRGSGDQGQGCGRSTTPSGHQTKSFETALAVAAAKRKDMRRQQVTRDSSQPTRTQKSATSSAATSDVEEHSTASSDTETVKLRPKLPGQPERSAKNGYLNSTASARLKSGRQEEVSTSGRRGVVGGPVEKKASSTYSSNSSINSRRRGSNASSTSTEASHQSNERLNSHDDVSQYDVSQFRPVERSGHLKTTTATRGGRPATQTPLAAARKERILNGVTGTTNSSCNRLRCKQSSLPQQQTGGDKKDQSCNNNEISS